MGTQGGLGSTTDHQGFDGWEKTNSNFQSVLTSLRKNHCKVDTTTTLEKNKNKTIQSRKKLVLAKNKVTAGHARKMRQSKDLSCKRPEDLSAIFGDRMTLPPKFEMDEPVDNKAKKKKKKKSKKKRRKMIRMNIESINI